jgi:predicted N-acetyltransferase YhbS
MIIREASVKDTPEIVNVLRASLGETKLPKSEKIWKYKHFDNPFGKSLVLVAEENGMIIGVRAFMKWQWQLNGKSFFAFRAVDTATHPNHQGKGIFKKLTLRAIEVSKEKGHHFIFNTPNEQSLPGYLKMGWKDVSKLPIQLIPVNPIRWIKSKNGNWDYNFDIEQREENLLNLLQNYSSIQIPRNKLFTSKSVDYLKWRYHSNPLQKYDVDCDNEFYVAAYVKEHGKFNELRIVEHIYINTQGLLKIKKSIKRFLKNYNCQVITASPELSIGGSLTGKFGPILTLREININTEDFNFILNVKNWSYHLGDLELF